MKGRGTVMTVAMITEQAMKLAAATGLATKEEADTAMREEGTDTMADTDTKGAAMEDMGTKADTDTDTDMKAAMDTAVQVMSGIAAILIAGGMDQATATATAGKVIVATAKAITGMGITDITPQPPHHLRRQ